MTKLWLSTDGRIPIAIFWSRFLAPVAFILGVTLAMTGGGLPFLFICLLVVVPFSIGAVKRLHDLNFPGWIGFLLYIAGPVMQLGWLLFGSNDEPRVVLRGWSGFPIYADDFAFLAGAAWFFLFVFTTVFISLSPGTKGSNKYGPNPVG